MKYPFTLFQYLKEAERIADKLNISFELRRETHCGYHKHANLCGCSEKSKHWAAQFGGHLSYCHVSPYLAVRQVIKDIKTLIPDL